MTEHKYFVFRFADVELREREFSVTKAGEPLLLEPKAFRVLQFLLHHPNKLVTKDELLEAVWKDVAVTENSPARAVAQLRRVLGDNVRDPRFIATVTTAGYRFICNVEVIEDGFRELRAEEPGPPHAAVPIPSAAKPESGANEKSVKGLPPYSRRSIRPLFVAIVAALGLALLGGLLIYYISGTRQPVKSASSTANLNLRVVPLTSLPGWARGPALSPDGDRVAFFWNGEMPAKWSLYVQLVGGEEPLQLTRPTNGILCCADWSPDGHQIVFGRCDDSGGAVFIVPALGGAERKVTDVVCSYSQAGYPRWTADGKSLVLIDRCSPEGSDALVLFSLSTGEKKCLHAPPADNLGDRVPSLSPDGKAIAFLESPSIAYGELYTIQTSGTGLRQLTHDQTNMGAPMWSPDGKNIIFYSARADFPHFWTIPAEGGAIAPEATYPGVGSISRDGRRLAYEEPGGFSNTSTVWRAEFSSAGGRVVSQKRMLGSAGGNNSAQLSPDGSELAFVSGRSGVGLQIWKSDADGAHPLQLTSFNNGFAGTPRWSPDGKFIVFDYHTAAHTQIYLVDPDGRNLHAITSGNYENVVPSFSRDGRAIYFASNRTHDWQVWKHEISTGRETQMTHQGGFAAFESYDGRTLFFSRFAGGGIWAMPVSGGSEVHMTDAPHRHYWGHFAVTDSGLYVVDSSTEPGPTIFFYNFKTRRTAPVLMLKKDPVAGTANLASSRDGRTLFYAEWEPRRSIMLAENFQ